MKVFDEVEILDLEYNPVIYSEVYVVNYSIQNPETTFFERRQRYYYSNRNDAHKLVEKRFKKRFPKAEIISIIYQ